MLQLTEIDQLLIEKKLDNTLTETEKMTFNQRLADPNFASELKRYQQAVQAVYAFGDANLKALLQEEEQKLQKKKAALTPQYPIAILRPVWRRWAVAASLLVAIGLTAQVVLHKMQESKSVYARYFKPEPTYSKRANRDRADAPKAPKDDFEKAFTFYDNGEYEAALTYFEKIPAPVSAEETPQYDVLFFKANAYLATKQTAKAIPIFEQLSQNKATKWQLHAEWYLAIALSKEQPDKANVLFEKIRNTENHPFQKQAVAVLASK
jgi:hypothetical protein